MNHLTKQRCPLSLIRMILLFCNYFVGYNLLYPIWMVRITKWLDPMARTVPQWMQLLTYGWMIISSVWLALPLLKESYIGWKQNRRRFFLHTVLLLVSFYICTIVVNLIIILISGMQTSANQSEVITAVESMPYLSIFSTLIYAPIVEEILFRGVFYRALRPHMKWFSAALISAFLFGFIHVMQSFFTGNFADMIFLLSYGLIGFFMALAYEINDTIYGSMCLHFLNNAIALLLLMV